MTDIEDADCVRCGKPVHLQHDPPCDHGTVQCPEHDAPACCDEAWMRTVMFMVMAADGGVA